MTSGPDGGFIDWMTPGDPEPCPECGSEDAEYLPHEPDCPSGYPTRDDELTALQDATREYEDGAY